MLQTSKNYKTERKMKDAAKLIRINRLNKDPINFNHKTF